MKSRNSKVKIPPEAKQCLLFLVLKKSQHLQCIVADPPSEDPSASAANPIESQEAIKIPSCHKKPLRRVDAGRLLAHMKRIPALLFTQLQTGSVFALVCPSRSTGSDKKRTADQEALNFYNPHCH